ncbi:MAG: glycosyltransferase, partial [Acidimicrobiales bacterium]
MDSSLVPVGAAVPEGATLSMDPLAVDYGPGLVAGGSPWRLLRLSGVARGAVERWRSGGSVEAGDGRLARSLVDAGLFFVEGDPDTRVDDVDVVVPVRDDPERLDRLLTALVGLHVTVVDDASHDAPAVVAVATNAGARLVRRDASGGPGAARNSGARATSRPLVWFIDADVQVGDARDVVARLRAPLADPRVGVVAPRVVGAAGLSQRDRFEARFSPLDQGPRDALVRPGGAVGFVPAACLLVRRDALGDGFDESMRVGEDVDLVWHAVERGWLVRYVASTVVQHHARDSWRAWWGQRRAYGRSSADLAARHGSAAAPLGADRWTLIAWGGA